jgi:hypothetical protein
MTFNITTFSIKGLLVTLNLNDNKHNELAKELEREREEWIKKKDCRGKRETERRNK